MAEPTLAAQHPTETWAALLASAAIVMSLVGIIYHRMNKDIESETTRNEKYRKETDERFEKCKKSCAERGDKDKLEASQRHYKYRAEVEERLAAGQASFTLITKDIATITERLLQIKEEDDYELKELDRIELEIKGLHNRLLTIEIEHKRCQDIVNNLK